MFQISEELEKVKQEMEEKGSSMTDGGKTDPNQCREVSCVCVTAADRVCVCVCSTGGEDTAEFDQTEAGDCSDGR